MRLQSFRGASTTCPALLKPSCRVSPEARFCEPYKWKLMRTLGAGQRLVQGGPGLSDLRSDAAVEQSFFGAGVRLHTIRNSFFDGAAGLPHSTGRRRVPAICLPTSSADNTGKSIERDWTGASASSQRAYGTTPGSRPCLDARRLHSPMLGSVGFP